MLEKHLPPHENRTENPLGEGRTPSLIGKLLTGRHLLGGFAIALLLTLGAVYGSGVFRGGHDHAEEAVSGEKYTCPMHPSIITDQPGVCPICGMDLVKIEPQLPDPKKSSPAKNELDDLFETSTEGSPKPGGERKLLFYRHPMDPSITSKTAAKDEMGMDYVAVYEGDDQPMPTPGAAGGMPSTADLATIRVGTEALRLSGVQTAVAKHDPEIKRTVRTVGIVLPDETRVHHIHTKVAGWIETLSTNFTGQEVESGQPLLSIYSPELLATQEEFLTARQTALKFAASTPEIKALGQDLLQSARRRLELFDVPPVFIAELEKSGTVQRSVPLVAPVTGFVTAKGIVEGQQVEPGLELFTITDLSHVWIEADLYEYEAGAVAVGKEACLTLSSDPGQEFKGTVAYVFPYLSAESRTLKVRFDFPNPDLQLKPQMYADVTMTLAQAEGVTVPDSALIDTGVRQVVFVETAAGTFEPRAVFVGVRGGGQVQISKGLSVGERVVVKANFLLDSESRLRAALNKVIGGGGQ